MVAHPFRRRPRYLLPSIAGLLMLSSLVSAVEGEQADTGHRPVAGFYKIYGGSLGDETPVTAGDKKVMFWITGAAAKNLFRQIGPDIQDHCTEGQGIRVRQRDRGNLMCLRSREGSYSCHFGFDLTNGKSIGGIIC